MATVFCACAASAARSSWSRYFRRWRARSTAPSMTATPVRSCATRSASGWTAMPFDPVTRQEDCPNYGAAGNASPFDNPNWDGYLVLAVIGWFSAGLIEVGIMASSGGRDRVDVELRATCVFILTILISCQCLGLLIVCH